ncbi:MAG: MBL fold metallo-hydrolase [Mailhella sp.]|nr:MBL fold metallo-hydrolase [Mailhella sp.]
MPKINVHTIRIDFHVTATIERFVYVYVVEAEHIYLIDPGVFGSERQILECLANIGKDASDIKGIFLTHAHPDHIGSAAWFQEQTGCKIYASEGEKRWIEDIDLQFKERPIPNFYGLAGKSSRVDVTVKGGDLIKPEEGLEIAVFSTPGHSHGDVSYLVDRKLFIGDAVPVKGDIPIFINETEIRKTLGMLEAIPWVESYYPAWDHVYSRDEMKSMLRDAREIIDLLKSAVKETDEGMELPVLTDLVSGRLHMPMLKTNPLFMRTVACLRNGRS